MKKNLVFRTCFGDVYNCVLCKKSNKLFCYWKINEEIKISLRMSCNFNGGHGSFSDFQHYTHPWSKLRTKGGISYKSCLSIILGHKSSKWFGTDGKLVALPNPLRKKPTRPINLDDDTVSSNDPLTFFCPPTLPGTF